jgi:HK97 family phage prohead protease
MPIEMKKMAVPFEVKQLQEDDDFFTFIGHAATFGNIDRGDDVIMRGAFNDTLRDKASNNERFPVLWQHQTDMPIGIFPKITEDEIGLFVEGRLPKEDTFVSGRVMPQMRVGSINTMSIGFTLPSVDAFEIEDGIRKINKITLWEISLVTIPMNPQARVTDMKSIVPFQDLPLADRNYAWDSKAAKKRVCEWSGAKNELSVSAARRYKSCFIWCGEEQSKVLDSYKLPIADIVDGELTAVPRAIFAAATAVQGARGGVAIPENDVPRVKAHIDRYYDKMGLESPFKEESSLRLDDMNCVDERTLEKVLKSGVCFSNKMAKTLISILKSSGLRDEDPGNRDGYVLDRNAVNSQLDQILKRIGVQKNA